MFQIIQERLGERKEPLQQLFGGAVLDGKPARFQVHAWGQGIKPGVVNARGDRNGNAGSARKFPQSIELRGEPFHAAEFHRKLVAGFKRSQSPEQGIPIKQEGAAGLVAAESVQELDGAAAPDLEDGFNDGAVNDGYRELLEFVLNSGKSKQPIAFGAA